MYEHNSIDEVQRLQYVIHCRRLNLASTAVLADHSVSNTSQMLYFFKAVTNGRQWCSKTQNGTATHSNAMFNQNFLTHVLAPVCVCFTVFPFVLID